MDGAKVGIFEDSKQWRDLLIEIVEEEGHTVPVVASDMEDACLTIDGLQEGDLDVAVVDGNLDQNGYKESGTDGAEITQLLRAKLGNVTVIGFTAGSKDVVGVDHSVHKTGDPGSEIPAIIAAL